MELRLNDIKEIEFYMAILVYEYVLENNKYFYIDNYYTAIQEIAKDYAKSEEYKKDESLMDSIVDYIKNNKRLAKYILNKQQVRDSEI